jgi:hypothetical protein
MNLYVLKARLELRTPRQSHELCRRRSLSYGRHGPIL